MATPIKNNLPPGSQQWVRDIEQRMIALERQNTLLQATANQNATQIGSISSALLSAQTGLAIALDGVRVQSSSHEIYSGGSGNLTLTFAKPSWANYAAVMVITDTTANSVSPSNGWNSGIGGAVYRSVGETLTYLDTVSGADSFVTTSFHQGSTASGAGALAATLPSNVTGIVIRGEYYTQSMPAMQSVASFSVTGMVFWYPAPPTGS